VEWSLHKAMYCVAWLLFSTESIHPLTRRWGSGYNDSSKGLKINRVLNANYNLANIDVDSYERRR
jgi:hypothetical protein